MRGRATRVALPALIVVVLVAVVAVAASGSVPRGSSASRAPSKTVLDAFFTFGVIAFLAGAAMFAYGLTQRKAIAGEIATGRYRRTSLAAFLAFSVLFAAYVQWRLEDWKPKPLEESDVSDVINGGGDAVPRTPPGSTVYEPAVSWISIGIVAVLVLAVATAYVIPVIRARPARDQSEGVEEQLAAALDNALDDLRGETDPRRAIIAAYARLERVLAANGIPRHASETSDEYLERVLHDLELRPEAIGRLTELFTQAKFSHHDVDSTMKESAIEALGQVRDELRALSERPRATEPQVPRAATT